MLSNINGHLTYYLFRLLGLIPLQLRSRLGWAIGFSIALLPSKALELTKIQLKCFLNPNNPTPIARQVFAQIGQTAFECIDLSELLYNPKKYFSVSDENELHKIISKKRGIVALTAHMANFDAMGAFFSSQGLNLMAVAKQVRNPALQFALEKLRDSFKFKTLWRADRRGIKKIMDALEAGWVVASLVDHDTRVSSSMIPFFGRPANTPNSLVELAQMTNSVIVTAFTVRKPNCKFEVIVREIPNNLSTEEVLSIFNSQLEEVIRRHPEQWNWMHKRWRTVNGERLGGKEYLEYLKGICISSS
jgi:KDO2-lipid IV(A) lauroyltransferase